MITESVLQILIGTPLQNGQSARKTMWIPMKFHSYTLLMVLFLYTVELHVLVTMHHCKLITAGLYFISA